MPSREEIAVPKPVLALAFLITSLWLPTTFIACGGDETTATAGGESSTTSGSGGAGGSGPCPDGHVCGGGEAVACAGPIEFAANPDDAACTPAAYCPAGSVCGSGVVVLCEPTTTFANNPTDLGCTGIELCPPDALCDRGAGQVCSAECVAGAFAITDETAPTREMPWVKGKDEALVGQGKVDAKLITSLLGFPLLMPRHPGQASVPGPLPPDTEMVRQTVTIDASSSGRSDSYWYSSPGEPIWRSTGLFAEPGTVFTVELPEAIVNGEYLGLEVQVGSHRDRDLVCGFPFDQPIRRFPDIVHRVPLTTRITAMTSAFGGLIYVRVMAGTALGPVDVTITRVARAPRYVHGVTDLSAWQDEISQYPAPWAELENDKIVLTVRSSDLKGVDPKSLMEFWTKAMDAVWYLAGIDDPKARIERIAADPAIEGIAHSGYPISMAEKWSYALLDTSEQKENQWWTTFHELGHNFQLKEWTFTGLQEATCNLWSLHVLETAAGVPRQFTHPDEEMGDIKRQARIQAYVDDGRKFASDWQTGFNAYQGFLPVEAFMQLQEAFGWKLLHDMNAYYRALAEQDKPKTTSQRIQLTIVQSSQYAGVDLSGFYEDWGFPLSAATKQTTGMLPAWNANPMDIYD